jgi:hypothetical protein
MTTQNTHTPGPWTVESCKNEDGSPFLSISGQGPFGAWLADIQPGSVNGKPLGVTQRDEANARLIAAAPDLLAAIGRDEQVAEKLYEHTSCDSAFPPALPSPRPRERRKHP